MNDKRRKDMQIILPLGQTIEQCKICNNDKCKACHTDKIMELNCPDYISPGSINLKKKTS
jgi:hypothetical protein